MNQSMQIYPGHRKINTDEMVEVPFDFRGYILNEISYIISSGDRVKRILEILREIEGVGFSELVDYCHELIMDEITYSTTQKLKENYRIVWEGKWVANNNWYEKKMGGYCV
jgi:hypothetical protein